MCTDVNRLPVECFFLGGGGGSRSAVRHVLPLFWLQPSSKNVAALNTTGFKTGQSYGLSPRNTKQAQIILLRVIFMHVANYYYYYYLFYIPDTYIYTQEPR
jgi:hypothetical protein